MTVLVTGCAGFIGYHLCELLIKENIKVIGIDSVNDYYDVNIKKSRLDNLSKLAVSNKAEYVFIKIDLCESNFIKKIFDKNKIDYVVHLAAQAGVRHSIENPMVYVKSNVEGFTNVLEACKKYKIKHLIYASTSSVYGSETNMPLSEELECNMPIQFYAATKKANELMAHSYSHLFNLPTTGLRFFTVYGPWGRPDMALFKFTKSIINNEVIEIYNKGEHVRDFTYVADVCKSILILLKKPPLVKLSPLDISEIPYRILNIGSNNPIKLMQFIEIIEKKLGKVSKKKYLPMQPGDILKTHADVSKLIDLIEYAPNTKIDIGISNFIDWYLDYY
tara:strand:- start:17716 stop:18714 length:999 start_codon:yes stop_codon:yes gene_type:complete